MRDINYSEDSIESRTQRILDCLIVAQNVTRYEQALAELLVELIASRSALANLVSAQIGRYPELAIATPAAAQNTTVATESLQVQPTLQPLQPLQSQQMQPQQLQAVRQTLADHPLASTALDYLPYEYRQTAWAIMQSARIGTKTIIAAIVAAIIAGIWTGKIAIPDHARQLVCPQPVTPVSEVKQ